MNMLKANEDRARLTFSLLFTGFLIYLNTPLHSFTFFKDFIDEVVPARTMEPTECFVDLTFEYTGWLNDFFRTNLFWRDMLMISDAFLIDITLLYSLFALCNEEIKSFRIVIATIFYTSFKVQFQQHVAQLGRLPGYMFFYPGMPSMSVPYFDVNDFYFSGHMALTFVLIYEFRAQSNSGPDEKRPAAGWLYLWYFMVFYNCFMMTVLRAHYSIDLLAGVAMGYLCARHAEWASFFLDVKVCGLPKSKRRSLTFTICRRCGWSNEKI